MLPPPPPSPAGNPSSQVTKAQRQVIIDSLIGHWRLAGVCETASGALWVNAWTSAVNHGPSFAPPPPPPREPRRRRSIFHLKSDPNARRSKHCATCCRLISARCHLSVPATPLCILFYGGSSNMQPRALRDRWCHPSTAVTPSSYEVTFCFFCVRSRPNSEV